VTLGLDVDDTLRALARMTFADGARMRTALGPWLQTFQLTLLTIGSSLDLVLRPPDPVAVSGACAVLTRQLSAASSAAGGRLGRVTRPGRGLVTSEAGDLHWSLARRTGERSDGPLRPLGLPRSCGPVLVLDPDLDVLVTGRGTGVTTGEALVTSLFTRGTGPGVTAVPIVRGGVVTLARGLTLLPASRRLHCLLPATGNTNRGGAAVAAHLLIQVTGVTASRVTPRCAFMILAI